MPKFQTGYTLINDENDVELDSENYVDFRIHRASDRSKINYSFYSDPNFVKLFFFTILLIF